MRPRVKNLSFKKLVVQKLKAKNVRVNNLKVEKMTGKNLRVTKSVPW